MKVFETEEEFLTELYEVMKRHPELVMSLGPDERVRVTGPNIPAYPDGSDHPCLCPIEVILLDREAKDVTWMNTDYLFISNELRHTIMDAADFSSTTLMSSYRKDYDNKKLLRRLEVHDRLVRMSKEFEYDRSQPKEM